MYMRYLSPEAFGLFGFFILMQACMMILDMGLSPTLGREVARARALKNGFIFFNRLLKSFELIVCTFSIVIIIIIGISSDFIAVNWLNGQQLDLETVAFCISIMGVLVGFRFFSSLYRSGLIGFEDQVWLNGLTIILISFKFLGALLLLVFVSSDISDFFLFQLSVGFIEAIVFCLRFYYVLPESNRAPNIIFFDRQAVGKVAPFFTGIAYTSAIWILITQSDKLILSNILTLTDYGYFTLVALISGAIFTFSGPIPQALLPRMTFLVAQNRKDEMLEIYCKSSQIVTLIIFSVAIQIALNAEILLYSWTGDLEAARWGGEVLIWFALGNAILSIASFQFYLQTAFGDLKLHILGSTLSVLVQVPIIILVSYFYGALGAGIGWFCFRLIWFVFWTPIVHNKVALGLHRKWLLRGILPVIMVVVFIGVVMNNLFSIDTDSDRSFIFLKLLALGVINLFLAAITIPVIRNQLIFYFSSIFNGEPRITNNANK
jgi:O-antigen/teichoic acid export membrane protein